MRSPLAQLSINLCDQTPNAARPARREALLVTRFIKTATYAIDPTKTQRLIQRLRVSDTLLSGTFLVKTDQQLVRARVVLLQPLAKLLLSNEKLWLHGPKAIHRLHRVFLRNLWMAFS